MRKSLLLVPALALAALGLAACGGGEDHITLDTSTAAATTPTSAVLTVPDSNSAPASTEAPAPAPETTADGSKYTQKQLDAVKKLQDKYLAKYQGVFDDMKAALGDGWGAESDDSIEDTIADSCKKQYQSDDEKAQAAAMVTMFMGETLAKNHTDALTMVADGVKFDQEVAKIVGC